MNKSILGVLGFVVLVALSFSLIAGVAIAKDAVSEDRGRSIVAYDDSANSNSDTMVISTKNQTNSIKNMTYGMCVSEMADLKNTCYENVKSVKEVCVRNSIAVDDDKRTEQCSKNYKEDKNQCKLDFKEAKKTCMQYKKTFWDKVRFWM